jgi:DNA invertase Pin-like site-specific DNA recombinase
MITVFFLIFSDLKDYQVDQVFLEKGESAKTADRTQLKAALAYVAAKGDIDVFLVHKLDRAARQSLDYHMIVATLMAAGCKLVSATEQFDNETPSGRFMGGILALQAQFDNEVRTERCKSGMIESVKRGCWMWTALDSKPVRRGTDMRPFIMIR